MTTIHYTVQGSWPFPLDMLRRDQSAAETSHDQLMIDRMSSDHLDARDGLADKVSIQLKGDFAPAEKRWASFRWEVIASSERGWYEKREWDQRQAAQEAICRRALRKLTAEEIEALGLEGRS